jgi:hypothetical protein
LSLHQVKRGWTCWADGSTNVDKAGAAKDKAKENKNKGQKDALKDVSLQAENVQMNTKDNVTCGAFSNYKWVGITDTFGKAIFRHLSIDAMEEIMRLAQATHVDKHEDKSVLTTQVDATLDEDNLVKGSEVSSKSSADDNDPLSGWFPGPTKDVKDGEFKFFSHSPLTHLIVQGWQFALGNKIPIRIGMLAVKSCITLRMRGLVEVKVAMDI